jgi:sec-independent protein translocase protein TatA
MLLSSIWSPSDLLVIAVIFLLFFGGKKIPEMAKGIGEGIRNFKDGLKSEDHTDTKKQA